MRLFYKIIKNRGDSLVSVIQIIKFLSSCEVTYFGEELLTFAALGTQSFVLNFMEVVPILSGVHDVYLSDLIRQSFLTITSQGRV